MGGHVGHERFDKNYSFAMNPTKPGATSASPAIPAAISSEFIPAARSPLTRPLEDQAVSGVMHVDVRPGQKNRCGVEGGEATSNQ
jgi:hypothetical protein